MSFEDDLRRELLQTFVEEAEDEIQALNQHLLQLEQQPDAADRGPIIQQLFRSAHNLKGAARAVGLNPVSQLAHHLETIFGRLQDGELSPAPELFDVLYRGVDGIKAQIQIAAQGQEETGAGDEASKLIAVLEAAASGQPAPVSAEGIAPPAPPAQQEALVQAVASAPPAPESTPPHQESGQAQPSTPSPGPAPRDEGEETVRLSTQKLDDLMAHIGELQIARIAAEHVLNDMRELVNDLAGWDGAMRKKRSLMRRLLEPQGLGAGNGTRRGQQDLASFQHFWNDNERFLATTLSRADAIHRRMKNDNHRLRQVIAELQEDVRQTRLRPLSTILNAFPRMVRDLARATGKDVRLRVEGDETEVDRSVVELLRAPLVHLVRNAIDHGIERPDVRRAAGKDPAGEVHIWAAQDGDMITIQVSDDGAGIDVGQVRARAIQKGLVEKEQAAKLSDSEALWLIFRPGFSTRHTANAISGRGVGLDVVEDSLKHIQGSISVTTKLGQGTRFTLRIPLTIATTLSLLIQAEKETFALPISTIRRIIDLKEDAVSWVDGAPMTKHQGEPIPVASLASLLGLSQGPVALQGPALVVDSGERRAAFLVDRLLDVQELVVKNLPPPLYHVHHIAGASILGNGEAVLVLNGADLLQDLVQGQYGPLLAAPDQEVEAERPPSILVVDDSITTRTLEQSILQAAGYPVATAVDGADAWEQLQAGSFDLIVSDIDMPNIDGFDLTAAIRASEHLRDLPIILVTSLDSPEDRRRGAEVGADAYIVKGAFDQQHLLETIEKFI